MNARIPLCVCFLLAACGAQAVRPRSYRYADLVARPELGRHAFDAPLILEFAPGDRLPVELTFADERFELEPHPTELELVARQHCYVRIDREGIRASLDGRDFDHKPAVPGSFFVGFTLDAHEKPRLAVRVRTPRASR